jgi:hypothetical protein
MYFLACTLNCFWVTNGNGSMLSQKPSCISFGCRFGGSVHCSIDPACRIYTILKTSAPFLESARTPRNSFSEQENRLQRTVIVESRPNPQFSRKKESNRPPLPRLTVTFSRVSSGGSVDSLQRLSYRFFTSSTRALKTPFLSVEGLE